jgi:hypothetical protein
MYCICDFLLSLKSTAYCYENTEYWRIENTVTVHRLRLFATVTCFISYFMAIMCIILSV